ncbi:hypothetical protein [Streptomyces sp. ODS05-4]|uniref:hypothetical protein n=1 Tax=Streptomyces sp. ODS05-4 TaxID=2944939 RepID=UPI00210E4542|nr:hypothetical protein [Streptomyces sp. ODS05-4]
MSSTPLTSATPVTGANGVPGPLGDGIGPAAPDDAGALTALLAASFLDDPLTRWITPDEERRRRVLPGFFRVFMELSADCGGVLATADRSAVLLYLSPDGLAAEARGAELEERFRGVLGEDARRLAVITALQAERHPAAPHCYISFGAVRSDRRRDGAMAALVGRVAALADAAGCGTYAEASSPGGEGSCRRNGFVRLGPDIVLPGDGPALRPMWRDPR